jgi:hypothetical protein
LSGVGFDNGAAFLVGQLVLGQHCVALGGIALALPRIAVELVDQLLDLVEAHRATHGILKPPASQRYSPSAIAPPNTIG